MRKVVNVELADNVQEAIYIARALDAAVRGLTLEEEAREGIALIFDRHFEQLERIQGRVSK
jgi:hypothetical protein